MKASDFMYKGYRLHYDADVHTPEEVKNNFDDVLKQREERSKVAEHIIENSGLNLAHR